MLSSQIYSDLNRKTDANLNRHSPLYIGGPVSVERGIMLHDKEIFVNNSVKVSDNLFMSSHIDILEKAHENKDCKFKFMMGYSGWSSGQLEDDVAGVIHCASTERTGIDIYMGIGGAPEGVLAAAALKCLGGYIQGKLIFRNDLEKNRAIKTGIKDFDKIYSLDDMVTKDVIFAATGVTDGSILRGAKWDGNILETETILMRSKTGSIRRLLYQQKFS